MLERMWERRLGAWHTSYGATRYAVEPQLADEVDVVLPQKPALAKTSRDNAHDGEGRGEDEHDH